VTKGESEEGYHPLHSYAVGVRDAVFDDHQYTNDLAKQAIHMAYACALPP
jgi:hypothetical protein